MRYEVGDPVVLKKKNELEEMGKIVGHEPDPVIVEITSVDHTVEDIYYHTKSWVITNDMIDHDKTAELKKDKTLNHYSGELEKIVAEKNKIHSNAAVEAKYTADKIDRHKELTDYMHQTYIRKNKDYGDSFSRVHREIGWQSSLGDIAHKFYRLQNLMQNKGERQVEDETTIDTLIDLANYSLLLAMELEDE